MVIMIEFVMILNYSKKSSATGYLCLDISVKHTLDAQRRFYVRKGTIAAHSRQFLNQYHKRHELDNTFDEGGVQRQK